MQRLPGVLLVVLTLAIGGLAAGAAAARSVHAAKPKSCTPAFTEGRGAKVIRVTNVGCATGRRVATKVSARAPSGCVKMKDTQGHIMLVKPCSKLGYRCTGRTLVGGRILDVTCKSGARVVRFQY